MTRRDRTVALVVAMAALIGAFWFLALAPTRKESSGLDKKIATEQQRLTSAQAMVDLAEKARRGYQGDYAAVARLGQAVPADDDVASLVYQIDKAAGSRINFSTIKLKAGGVTAPAPLPPPPAAGEDASGDKGVKGDAKGDAAADPAAAGAGVASALPPGAAVGPAGFPTMPFTFAFAGQFFDIQSLLEKLNRLTTVGGSSIDVRGRLLTVDRVELTAAANGFPALTMQVDATAYLVPKEEGLTNGATPAGPGNTTTVNDKPPAGGVPTSSGSAALITGASR